MIFPGDSPEQVSRLFFNSLLRRLPGPGPDVTDVTGRLAGALGWIGEVSPGLRLRAGHAGSIIIPTVRDGEIDRWSAPGSTATFAVSRLGEVSRDSLSGWVGAPGEP